MLRPVKRKLDNLQGKTIPKQWERYRKERDKILSSKRMLPDIKRYKVRELLDDTRKRIKYEYKNYREYKYLTVHESKVKGFDLAGSYRGKDYKSRTYLAEKDYNVRNLNKDVGKLLEGKTKGVLVKIQGIDKNGNPVTTAKFYNKETWAARQKGSVFQEVMSNANKKYGRLTKRRVYIEEIY